MKVTRAQAAENRSKIVEAASRLFREGGIRSTGVDAVMSAAGMTHGGFYGHFSSKDKLAAEACARALGGSLEKWSRMAGEERPLEAIAHHYLSTRHRDHPGDGCLIPTLAAEAPRCGPEVRQVVSDGVKSLLAVLAEQAPGADEGARQESAIGLLATMVGALVVSRAIEDPELSDKILAAASRSILPGGGAGAAGE